MTMYLRRIAALATITFFIATAYGQRSRISGPLDNGRRIALAGRVPARARAGIDLGRVPSTFELPTVTILLKASADSTSLVRDQQDPSSPQYHQWLTPEQYGERFGASQGEIDQITSWLESHGLSVVDVAPGRTTIMVSGTADQVQSAFQTEIHRFNAGGRQHYSNATDPSIPAALAPVIAGIRGLNDFHPKPRLRKPAADLSITAGYHALGPDDIAAIYDIAPLHAAGIDGTGQTIMVVGQTALQMSDLGSFRTKFGLTPPNVTPILVGRQSPGISAEDLNEADLDIQWAGAVARNATIAYYFSNDVWNSAQYAVNHPSGQVLSMSYGTCEMSDLVDLPSFQQLAQQANAQGITWFAASGDSGAADCDDTGVAVAQNGIGVDAPASIPEVTAMGGTEFNEQGDPSYWTSAGAAKGYIPEKVWNDTPFDGQLSAGGGGPSIFFPRPAWQTGPGVPNDNVRHVPDLALSASADHDGYFVIVSGQASYFGGTSAAAPVMAGIAALLNHYLLNTQAITKAGLGNINPKLYQLAQTNKLMFHDVTVGDNMVPCAIGTPNCLNGTFGSAAGPGYDQATGLGSVDAAVLVRSWAGGAVVRSSAVVPSIDQNPVFQQPPDASGNPWRFQITLREEAGVATTLTGFTVNGTSYPTPVATLFGSAAIPANGSVSASVGLKNLSVPTTVRFVFSGVDASGTKWTNELDVPFQGPQISLLVGGLSNAASGARVFAPGELIAVYGTGFSTTTQAAAAVPLPQFLAGFEAMVNGVQAPLWYVSPTQVNLQIPYETQPGPATLVVGNPYANVNYSFTVSSAGPGIFTFADGSNSVNPSRTGARDQIVSLYITGDGAVSPSVTTGSAPSSRTAPRPLQPVSITVGGVDAGTPQFIGIPSWSVGVTQINFKIPANAPVGPQPVVVTVGGVASSPAVITVQ